MIGVIVGQENRVVLRFSGKQSLNVGGFGVCFIKRSADCRTATNTTKPIIEPFLITQIPRPSFGTWLLFGHYFHLNISNILWRVVKRKNVGIAKMLKK